MTKDITQILKERSEQLEVALWGLLEIARAVDNVNHNPKAIALRAIARDTLDNIGLEWREP